MENDFAKRLSLLEQFQQNFDDVVKEKLSPLEAKTEQMKVQHDQLQGEVNTLRSELAALRKELKDLATAHAALQQTVGVVQATANSGVAAASQAQQTANAAMSHSASVANNHQALAEKPVLKELIDRVIYVRRGTFDFFCFPNLSAWDIQANGDFYVNPIRDRRVKEIAAGNELPNGK